MLGWEAKISLEEMVGEMVREDLKLAEKDQLCKREGFPTYAATSNLSAWKNMERYMSPDIAA